MKNILVTLIFGAMTSSMCFAKVYNCSAQIQTVTGEAVYSSKGGQTLGKLGCDYDITVHLQTTLGSESLTEIKVPARDLDRIYNISPDGGFVFTEMVKANLLEYIKTELIPYKFKQGGADYSPELKVAVAGSKWKTTSRLYRFSYEQPNNSIDDVQNSRITIYRITQRELISKKWSLTELLKVELVTEDAPFDLECRESIFADIFQGASRCR